MAHSQVVELARHPVPLEPIQQAVLAALALDESQQLQELPVLLAQSRDYASAGDAANALTVCVNSTQNISTQQTLILLGGRLLKQ